MFYKVTLKYGIADRINKVNNEQGLFKAEFSRRVGVCLKYNNPLTGSSNKRPTTIHHTLTKLIALEFGYDEHWILYRESNEQ